MSRSSLILDQVFVSVGANLTTTLPTHAHTHLPVQDGLPGGPLLVDGTLLRLLHGHLVLSVQQLQTPGQTDDTSSLTRLLHRAATLLLLLLPPPLSDGRGRFTCFYQRQSSEPQTWFLPPPPPPPRPPSRSSASSCSPLPL